MAKRSGSRLVVSAAFCGITALMLIADPYWHMNRVVPAPSYSYEAAKLALDLMKEWVTWMAAIQTAALAAVGVLTSMGSKVSRAEEMPVFCTVLFVGAALFVSAWVLASLPSVALRLVESASGLNDIFELRIFPGTPVRLGFLTTLLHCYWLVGLLCFGWLMWTRYP